MSLGGVGHVELIEGYFGLTLLEYNKPTHKIINHYLINFLPTSLDCWHEHPSTDNVKQEI